MSNENHLKAMFMGLTYENKKIEAPHGSFTNIDYIIYYDGVKEVTQLKYNSSWDALIPVIHKINETTDNFDQLSVSKSLAYGLIEKNYLVIRSLTTIDLNVVNDKVNQYIRFYNKLTTMI